jgi:acetyl-CoA hydrolase/transferase-like protein
MLDLSRYVRPGDGVWWGQGGAEPEPLVNALLGQAGAIGPVRAFSGLTWNERLAGPLPANLTLLSYGGLGLLRKLSRRGGLEVVPCHYSSLPRTRGASRLPLSAFAATIETDRPLREAPARQPDAADRAIGELVATLIEDGDTVQIGVGTLPSAVLGALSGHADLGFHTGMITVALDGGVVTTARSDVDAVVTEHGIAALAGCTVAERARRLVAVAAPHHREQLESSLVRPQVPA